MVMMLGGVFGVLHIGGALVHVWIIGWCLEVCRLEHCTCTSAHLDLVSVDFMFLMLK